MRSGERIEVLAGVGLGTHGADRRSDPVRRAVIDSLGRTRLFEGGEDPSHSAGREVHAAGQFGDARRLVGQGLEKPEGPLDALDAGHGTAVTSGQLGGLSGLSFHDAGKHAQSVAWGCRGW